MTTATSPSRAANEPSPHAQTPRPVGRTPWWVWLLIVAAVSGGTWAIVHKVRANRSADHAQGGGAGGRHGGGGGDQPVVVATARRGDLPVYLYGLGTVTPLQTVTLRTRVDGAITQIHYTEGQHVKTGDFLLQIDPRPYQAVLDQAKGQLVKDRATLASAVWNVQQDQQAILSKAIAEQQVHTDTATRDNTQGAIDVDQANIEAAQVNLDYCHVTSPIDGVIGLRLVDNGNIVHASDTTALTVITQLKPITVIFTLPEGDLATLRRRMDTGAPVQVDAYDTSLTHRLARGTLLATDSAIDPTTGTVKVKATFDNGDDALFPNQFVNARLLVDTIRGAVLIPTSAIQTDATGSKFVYAVRPGTDTVDVRSVTPGRR